MTTQFEPTKIDMTKKIDFEIALANARKDWLFNHQNDPRMDDEEWVNIQLDHIEERMRTS